MNDVLINILNAYKDLSEVKAVAIGGSSVANTSDNISDIDIYIFVYDYLHKKHKIEFYNFHIFYN